MNKNLLIAIIVILVAVGAFFFFKNKPESQITPTKEETQEQATITLTSTGFSPENITIKAGQKVTWLNKSGTEAAVNSDPHPTHTNYAPLNLGSFADGASLILTFDKAGTYGYHNHLNPNVRGTIIVQ